jgi:hypothetical protein
LGSLECIGSTQFLKSTYGAGYKLIFDSTPLQLKKILSTSSLTSIVSAPAAAVAAPAAAGSEPSGLDLDKLSKLTKFVLDGIPGAKYEDDSVSADNQITYILPFESVKYFGQFFTKLENNLGDLGLTNFGVTITSLEDVFLKVGEDHTVTPTGEGNRGIGSDRQYQSNFM